MKRTIVRIKDIAEKAGVSTGTVDRVLHNRGRVSEKARKKVLKIAKELDYEPNILARTLVSNRVYHFAALIPDPAADEYWADPKTGIDKAEKELKQYGVSIQQFVFNPFKVDSFRKEADKIAQAGFDGILAAPIFYRESLFYFSLWKRKAIPFILFNTHIPDYEPLMYIGQDSYQSGYLAGKLLHYGLEDPATFLVAHIDEDVINASHLIKKEQGFVEYFSQNTADDFHQVIQRVFLNSSDKAAFRQKMDAVLQEYPKLKGIFVTNSHASAVADYLHNGKITHIRLIGYDLMEKNLYFLNKGVIDFLINQNPKGQGYWGIYGLAECLVFQKKVKPIKYMPLDIITRENLDYYIEADR